MDMETKRRMLTEIEDLKYRLLSDTATTLEGNSGERNYRIFQRLQPIMDEFVKIMKSKGITVDEDYMMSQMDVLRNEIKIIEEGPDQDLYSAVSIRLNRYIEALEYEQDLDEVEKQTQRSKKYFRR